MQKDLLPRAVARAINRAVDTVRFEMTQKIAAITGLGQTGERGVRAALPVRGANAGNLSAVINARPRAANLIRQMTPAQVAFAKKFWKGTNTKAATRKRVVSVNANAWGPTRAYQRLFTAPTGAKKAGLLGQAVFKRTSVFTSPTKGKYAGRRIKRGPRKGQLLKRERIKAAHGETVPHAVLRDEVLIPAQETFYRRFNEDLPAQLSNLVKQELKQWEMRA